LSFSHETNDGSTSAIAVTFREIRMHASDNTYHLVTVWQFDAPIQAVWDAILDAEAWPQWWRGVERVVTIACGDVNGVGARRHYTCKSTLPFRLSFVSQVTRIEPLRLIEGQVEGALEGLGRCQLDADTGLVTVRYEWHVHTTRAWMNLLGPLARPLFRWNHDALMQAGGIGLTRHLGALPASTIRRGAAPTR